MKRWGTSVQQHYSTQILRNIEIKRVALMGGSELRMRASMYLQVAAAGAHYVPKPVLIAHKSIVLIAH